jgi:hypothetical protein
MAQLRAWPGGVKDGLFWLAYHSGTAAEVYIPAKAPIASGGQMEITSLINCIEFMSV